MELNYDVIYEEIKNNWGKGATTNRPGFYQRANAMTCLLGAANKTAGITEENHYAAKEVYGITYEICYNGEVATTFAADVAPVIVEMFPSRVCHQEDNVEIVWRFNDHSHTTHEEVLAVIDEVIRRKALKPIHIPEQFMLVDSGILV